MITSGERSNWPREADRDGGAPPGGRASSKHHLTAYPARPGIPGPAVWYGDVKDRATWPTDREGQPVPPPA